MPQSRRSTPWSMQWVGFTLITINDKCQLINSFQRFFLFKIAFSRARVTQILVDRGIDFIIHDESFEIASSLDTLSPYRYHSIPIALTASKTCKLRNISASIKNNNTTNTLTNTKWNFSSKLFQNLLKSKQNILEISNI